MTSIKVNLWGVEIGRLVWDSATRRTYFMYNPAHRDSIPDIAPLLSPADYHNRFLPVYGDDRPLYQGLPPFIADSLPDSWGNTLFDKWVTDNRIPRNKITSLYKLMFIGTRGMGALEYEPSTTDFSHTRAVDIQTLYDMSLKILADRNDTILTANDQLTLQALLAVGTSAGGRQMKAIIAINKATGEIRSGQTDGLDGFEYYILKFGDTSIPIAEIETAYYHMACAAGIEMQECRLLPADGINHFLTKRFDRKCGTKIHVQTLAAINPEARCYEDLFETCRRLSIPESGIDQLFTRMVFNVMANNTDDHNKNFSFLLKEGGHWQLAPAYDMTFIFNTHGTGPNIGHRFGIGGKIAEISKSDLLDFAGQNAIRNAPAIITRVADAISRFEEFAAQCDIPHPWRSIIQKSLTDNLNTFGYTVNGKDSEPPLYDSYRREITVFSIAVNSKGHYDVTAIINGQRHRRFIRPNMNLHSQLSQQDIYNLPASEKIRLTEILFPKQ